VTADQEGSLWLNGLVFGGVLGGPQQALMRGIFAEMQTLQEHVYYQAIQDDTPDILAELLRLEGALQRYNPRILEKPSSPDRYNHCTLEQPCFFDVDSPHMLELLKTESCISLLSLRSLQRQCLTLSVTEHSFF